MTSRALLLTIVALGLCPTASLAAGRPALAPLSDAFDGNIAPVGAALQTDGSRS